MPANSPPKHRHDGTSPLPLGMDWSPPPKKWEGRNTVWPHNPHTGWSYCVMVPSWIVQTESGASRDNFLNPIVFFRIHVGVQSPEGVSTSHGILRRFSDFLKLYSALKRAFPKKDIPPAPPKHAFLRINSSRMLLEERRQALEDWMGKLLSDIDLSRSASVAGFLELEAAARSAFQDVNHHPSETGSSAASDIGGDNACETSDMGVPSQGRAQISECSAEDLTLNHEQIAATGAIVTIGNGLLGESILDQTEEFCVGRSHHRRENLVSETDAFGGNSANLTMFGNRIEAASEQDDYKLPSHARRLSAGSVGSDVSSTKGSELSLPGMGNSIWDGSVDLSGSAETPNTMEALSGLETQFSNDGQIVLPFDQRHKLNRILVTVQRRLVTAKTDMEDLIARLNQEMAVKEYLMTKVKDLEVELEATKQKGKENLQQALLIERERITQMQWNMDELRRKYCEMESKLKSEQDEKTRAESEKTTASGEKELLLQKLDTKQDELRNTRKRLEELEMKSKSDIKVLVKEVKFLRSSQAELKEALDQSLKEKNELERTLHNEKQRRARSYTARKKLLHECRILHDRLQECSMNFISEGGDRFTISPSSLSDASDLLAMSDNRIGLLLAEAQLLARDDEQTISDADKSHAESSENLIAMNGEDLISADDGIRKMLSDIFIDNARLRKQVNSVMRCAVDTIVRPDLEGGDEAPSRKTVLNRFLER